MKQMLRALVVAMSTDKHAFQALPFFSSAFFSDNIFIRPRE